MPIPYVNIGIINKSAGTLTDPDGSFYLRVPKSLESDTIIFSAVGFKARHIPVLYLSTGRDYEIKLEEKPITLSELEVTGIKNFKSRRLGWMRGKDGTLPVDSAQGGACATLLLEAPGAPSYIEKVYLRILYNTKDTIRFRLRIFDVDSLTGAPGIDLIEKDVFITEQKRIGWIKADISDLNIEIPKKKFYLGFEWIEDRQNRDSLISSLQDWEKWKQDQYLKGDENAVPDTVFIDDKMTISYRYNGNMMNWPGFQKMPPWTGLVVDDEKRSGNEDFVTYERKMSFGKWHKSESVLNAVLVVSY